MDIIGYLPDSGPGWSILAVIITLIFGAPAIFSEKVAKEKFWVISSLARSLQNRRVNALEKESAYSRAQARLYEEQINDLIKSVESLKIRHDRENAELREHVQLLDKKLDNYYSYIVWSSDWARDVIIIVTRHGIEDHVPQWLSYNEWYKKHGLKE